MAIAYDATSTAGYQTASSIYSWSHTSSGIDRCLFIGVSMLSVAGSSVSGIILNPGIDDLAFTFIGAQSSAAGAVRVELWRLLAAVTGSSTVQVSLSAALDSIASGVSFTGVHQGSPTEGWTSATATNVGAADATVDVTTSTDGDWVLDVVAASDTTITVGTGQTQRQNVSGTLGSGAMSTEGPKSPPGTVTMSWTDVGAGVTWSIGAVGVKPASAARFRKTLSSVGTRTGNRQRHGWGD